MKRVILNRKPQEVVPQGKTRGRAALMSLASPRGSLARSTALAVCFHG